MPEGLLGLKPRVALGLELVATWAEELSLLVEVLLISTVPAVLVMEEPENETVESAAPTRTAAAISRGMPMLLGFSSDAELEIKAWLERLRLTSDVALTLPALIEALSKWMPPLRSATFTLAGTRRF